MFQVPLHTLCVWRWESRQIEAITSSRSVLGFFCFTISSAMYIYGNSKISITHCRNQILSQFILVAHWLNISNCCVSCVFSFGKFKRINVSLLINYFNLCYIVVLLFCELQLTMVLMFFRFECSRPVKRYWMRNQGEAFVSFLLYLFLCSCWSLNFCELVCIWDHSQEMVFVMKNERFLCLIEHFSAMD
jgi:hypothetical protein